MLEPDAIRVPRPTPATLPEALRMLANQDREMQAMETRMNEMAAVMTDLLIENGIRQICPHCGAPGFWMRRGGTGSAVLYNPDGTQHWPRCPQTARPKPPAKGEAA